MRILPPRIAQGLLFPLNHDDFFLKHALFYFSSKLASLFGVKKTSGPENSSLIYTPPKQPRKEASPNRTPPNEVNKANKLDIILAKGVQAHKL